MVILQLSKTPSFVVLKKVGERLNAELRLVDRPQPRKLKFWLQIIFSNPLHSQRLAGSPLNFLSLLYVTPEIKCRHDFVFKEGVRFKIKASGSQGNSSRC